MSEKGIVIKEDHNDSGLSIYMPAMTIQEAVERYNALVNFTKAIMKKDHDYGIIPGTDKPTLYKAGAEKLSSFFGLSPKFILIDKIIDFDKGLFYYHYRCELYRNGQFIGDSDGSANSMEKKYRWRNVPEKKATAEDKAMAVRQEIRSGKYGDYIVYVVPNTEPFELVNTLQKMAQKRALVAAVLIATNASEFFTQDVEDMNIIEGEWQDVEPRPSQPPAEPVQTRRTSSNKPTVQAVPANVNKTMRPAAPEVVKERIEKLASNFAKNGEFKPTEQQRNLLRYGLELCFEGQDMKNIDDKRHTLLKYLVGDPSTKNVTGSQFKAIVDKWLEMKPNPDGSGDYIINPFSAEEAESIVAAALVAEGQQKLEA